MRWRSILVAVLIGACCCCSLQSTTLCTAANGIDELSAYLSWSDAWVGTGFAQSAEIPVKTAAFFDGRFWYLPSARLIVVSSASGKTIDSMTCAPGRTIEECTAPFVEAEEGASETGGLIIGLPQDEQRPEAESSPIHHCVVRGGNLRWKPSPPGSARSAILRKAGSVVYADGKGWGDIIAAKCNEPNVQDPYLFCVLRVVNQDENEYSLLYRVKVHLNGEVSLRSVSEIQLADNALGRRIWQEGIPVDEDKP